eukprot:TRINITY_DN18423_c0_g1_i1.p1 TRINITY_DN18423_c0_g1~~TRINITY_DN18423_c0_g1_i1.p1  ORF type:complete len:376 (+),score=73.53 TRINITY_DN18423_c0_g1_i1:114-1241(+)
MFLGTPRTPRQYSGSPERHRLCNDDRNSILIAVMECGLALEHATLRLRADKEVVITAVEPESMRHFTANVLHTAHPLQFASSALRSDKEVLLIAVSHHQHWLDSGGRPRNVMELISPDLRTDPEIVSAAAQSSGIWVDPNRKKGANVSESVPGRGEFQHLLAAVPADVLNEEIAISAVKHSDSGLAFKFLPDHFKSNPKVALAAVKHGVCTDQDGEMVDHVLMYASDELRNDHLLNVNAIIAAGAAGNSSKAIGALFELLPEALRQCPEFNTDLIVSGFPLMLKYAPLEIRDNKAVALAAVSADGCALEHVSQALKYDVGVVEAALQQTHRAQMFVPKDYDDQRERVAVSYTHLRAHETVLDLVCRLLLEKKKNT